MSIHKVSSNMRIEWRSHSVDNVAVCTLRRYMYDD